MPYTEWRGNKCRVRWFTGRTDPETGRKIYDSQSGFDDEEEAYNYGLDRESDVRNERFIPRRDGKLRMRDWAKQWIASVDAADTTLNAYQKVINAQINPAWGDKDLADIKEVAVRAWLNDRKAKYKPKYFQSVKLVMGLLLNDAASNRLIPASPMPAHNPRRGKHVRHEEEEDIFATPVQALAFAESHRAVWGFTGYVFALTKAYTGMRLGEMRGLRREFCHPNWPAADPNLKRRQEGQWRYGGGRFGIEEPMPALRVQWQAQYLDKQVVLLPPKYSSHRTLVIPPFLADLLAELLDSHDSEWVFPAPGGGSLASTDFYNYYWNPALAGRDASTGRWKRPKAAGVPELKGMVPHGLRHGHKTWLDEEDLPRVAVEARMGHEIPGVEGIYSHVTPPMEARIVKTLQRLFDESGRARNAEIVSQSSPSGSLVEEEPTAQTEDVPQN
jgi:integrase